MANEMQLAAQAIGRVNDIAQLRQLNEYLIRHMRDVEAQVRLALAVGDAVKFTGKRGVTLTGTVVGFSTSGKRPWVHVQTEFQGKWNVMPSQLTRLTKENRG